VDYGYPWSGVVGRFKFEQAPGWATALAQLMRSAPWVEPALDEADVLLPMPLSKERLQERGYNQALLLAQALLPHKVQARTLLRTRHTRAQSELPLKERLRNVEGAFALEPAHRAALAGQRVLLVDDVMTTGASLRAAALPLQQAGVAQLTCLVLARTPAPHDPTSSLEVR
jgi:ComF family protein